MITEKKQFEEWIHHVGFANMVNWATNGEGGYWADDMQLAWLAWQARASLPPVMPRYTDGKGNDVTHIVVGKP